MISYTHLISTDRLPYIALMLLKTIIRVMSFNTRGLRTQNTALQYLVPVAFRNDVLRLKSCYLQGSRLTCV